MKKTLTTLIACSFLIFSSLYTIAQVLVKDFDIQNGAGYLTDVNGTLYFFNFNGTTHELWESDGSSGGTFMVKALPGGDDGLRVVEMENVNGTLFFHAFTATSYESQLWKSDGTPDGTVLLKTPNPGQNGMLSDLSAVSSNLFFLANDPINGEELWKSDGTTEGTVMVTDLYPGYVGSSPSGITNINGSAYFESTAGATGSGNDLGLYKSDGTPSGTVSVKPSHVGWGGRPKELIDVNGLVYFYAQEFDIGWELWRSDGTDAGTFRIKDVNPGSPSGITAYYGYLTNVNGTVYFKANDGVNGQELWKTDGTDAGTVMVKDISTSVAGSVPHALINVDGTLFFIATDDTYGNTLWKSDGTQGGTIMVSADNAGDGYEFTTIGNTLFFTKDYALWKTDGTSEGTQLITTFSGTKPQDLTNVNGVLFFVASNIYDDYDLYKYELSSASINSVDESDRMEIIISPNPFSHSTTIRITNAYEEINYELKIYDVLGQEVHCQTLSSEIEILNLNLPTEIYFYKISNNKQELVGEGKLIIK